MDFIKSNPFAKPPAGKKGPESELVGTMLGERAKELFEQRLSKHPKSPQEDYESWAVGAKDLTEAEKLILESGRFDRQAEKLFGEADDVLRGEQMSVEKIAALSKLALARAKSGRDPSNALDNAIDLTNYFDRHEFELPHLSALVEAAVYCHRFKEAFEIVDKFLVETVELYSLIASYQFKSGIGDPLTTLRFAQRDAGNEHCISISKIAGAFADIGQDPSPYLEQAMKLLSERPLDQLERQDATGELSKALAKAGRFEEAIKMASPLVPSNGDVFRTISVELARHGNYADAFRIALSIDAGWSVVARLRTLTSLVPIFVEAGEDPSRLLQAAIDTDSTADWKIPEATSNLALAFAQAGRNPSSLIEAKMEEGGARYRSSTDRSEYLSSFGLACATYAQHLKNKAKEIH